MAYSAITEEVLSVIKAPPILGTSIQTTGSPPAYRDHGSGLKGSQLGDNLFQFRARFLYDDNEKSVWSAVSKVDLLHEQYCAIGYDVPNVLYQNRIQLDVVIPNDDTLLKMDIAVRFSNFGLWYITDTVDVSGDLGTTYTYDFYNDKPLQPIDPKDTSRPYDYVPLNAGAQEIIGGRDGAHLTYGDITEGFNNDITPNVALTKNFTQISSSVSAIQVDRGTGIATKSGGFWEFAFVVPTTTPNPQFSLEVIISGDGVSNRYTYPMSSYFDDATQALAGGTPMRAQIATRLIAEMDESTLCDVVAGAGTGEVYINFFDYIDNPEVQVVRYDELPVVKSLRDGASQYFGIVYGDKYGRLAPVRANSTTEIYIPHASETGGRDVDENIAVDYVISHTPPDWAYTWRWVYGGSSIPWSQTFVVRGHNRDDQSIEREAGYLKLKINEGLNNVRDTLENFSIPNYIWTEGDRLRVIGTREATDADSVNGAVTKMTGLIDLEVVKFDGVYAYINDWHHYTDQGAPDINSSFRDDVIVEIYRRRKDFEAEDIIFYGIGEVNDITNPTASNRTHANASGTLEVAEVYLTEMPLASLKAEETYLDANLTTSTTSTTTTTYAESDDYESDWGTRCFWVLSRFQSAFVSTSDVQDIGEVHIVDDDYKQQRLNNVRYSGIFITKTFINNLNRFEFDDDEAFDDKNGRLYSLREVGYTLKVLQRNKVTSLYVGREMSLDGEGNEVLVYSKDILGNKRPSSTDYGTQDPMSVVRTNRFLYFYDRAAGAVIRDGNNGQEEISKVGMQTWFRGLFDDFTGTSMIAGWDTYDDMVYFTLLGDTDVTMGYDEDTGRWESFYSFVPEFYGTIRDKNMLSFKSGALWKHSSSVVSRCNFYGVQYPCVFEIVSNANPNMIKTFESIEIASNAVWVTDLANNYIVSVFKSGAASRLDMASLLRAADFVEHEGVWRAPFNKDMYTSNAINAGSSMYDLYNGRDLKGHYISIILKNTDTTLVSLLTATVNSNLSR